MTEQDLHEVAFARLDEEHRPTHKEFGFNGIRFCTHIFNTEKEVDFAVEVLRRELT